MRLGRRCTGYWRAEKNTSCHVAGTATFSTSTDPAGVWFRSCNRCGVSGEVSRILTNQKRESTVFSRLIGQNLGPYPENTTLYGTCIGYRQDNFHKIVGSLKSDAEETK